MFQRVVQRLRPGDEDGQAMVEYGMIIAFIAGGVLYIFNAFANPVLEMFTNIVNRLSQVMNF